MRPCGALTDEPRSSAYPCLGWRESVVANKVGENSKARDATRMNLSLKKGRDEKRDGEKEKEEDKAGLDLEA